MPVFELPGMLIFFLFMALSTLFVNKEIIILLVFVRKFQIKPGWVRIGAAIISIPVITVGLALLGKLLQEPILVIPNLFTVIASLVFWGLVCLASWYILRLTNRQGMLLFAWMAGFGVLTTALMSLVYTFLMPDRGFLLAVN